MFAVIKTGGKQYRVKVGDVLSVEKLEAEKGQVVHFDQVLLLEDGSQVQVGTPYLEKARVAAEVLDDYKGEKVIVFKKKRRKGYRRKKGHRQLLTRVRISGIYPEGQAVETEQPATEAVTKKVAKKETTAKAKKPAAKKESGTARKTTKKETAGQPKEK
ncbi:MAG: 50S ribosomal protein L21 [Candidatus Saccharicenans sp.]|jgi:large subunit ribosomal protein L21|nr:50S ribosomal protein L21 [Candidatus Saccharicenans sp.]MDH7492937.1 50S ribosomal protein L21 [Candidatus Saccharicenans sp.]